MGIESLKDGVDFVIQFFKFGAVGLLNTIIALGIYYIFIWINNTTVMALLGQTVGWFFGVLNAFVLNRMFVFKESQEVWWKILIKLYIAYAMSLGIALVLTFVLIEVAGVSAIITPLLILFVTVPFNFLVSKYWSFHKKAGK
jgi:putative flippase GtrA